MSLKITKNTKPPKLSDRTRKLFTEAERAGFVHIGWLTVTMLQPLAVAGFTNNDGSIALAFLGPENRGLFEPQAIDMVSHFHGPKKLTTSTYPMVAPQFDRGIFKYSYPKATISQLLTKHQGHTRDLKGKPELFVKSLAGLKKSIQEYLAFELKAQETAPRESVTRETKLEATKRPRKSKADHNDPFAAIREAGTDGANYDLDTNGIIARLKQWQSLCAFRIISAEHDTVVIEFDTLPKNMDAFVRDLYDFCPDLVDQGTGCLHEMLEMMQEAGEKPTGEMQKLIEGVDFADEDYGLEILKREIQQKKNLQLWWD